MFESVKILRQRTKPNDTLEVIHGSHLWMAKFEWLPPIEELSNDGKRHTIDGFLPMDYFLFLQEISNGCLLYYDLMYGQWGYKLYSIEEFPAKQDLWKERLGLDWRENLVVFAELRGEGHVLLFDLSQPTDDGTSCAIMEGNPIDTNNYWPKVSRSFHEWLDNLVTAQGAKYWEWK